jgi:small subunit ribosomal protein S2
MSRVSYKELLDAGVHFGHLKRKWNPNMAPYIFMEKNGIHIIDLNKTVAKIDESANALKQIAKSGKKILFVATKKQAKDIVADKAKRLNMPYVPERWPGGMLTNFATIRKAIKKMATIDRMATDGTFENISKKERLQISRQREKLETNLGSITDLTRLPAALFIVDINKEHIAVAEAKKLNIPTFGIVDTNSDPRVVDFAIPANDDSSQSVNLVLEILSKAIEEGLSERKSDKEAQAEEDRIKDEEAKERRRLEVIDEDDDAVGGKKKIAKAVKGEEEDSLKRPAKKPVAKTKTK